jgi:hypothetical protein
VQVAISMEFKMVWRGDVDVLGREEEEDSNVDS